MQMVFNQHAVGGYPMELLATTPIPHRIVAANAFVKYPEGFYCRTCDERHGYPSRELDFSECYNFLIRLHGCTHQGCAILEHTRWEMFVGKDYLHEYFTGMEKKFDSFQELTTRNPNLNWADWKLVREFETTRNPLTEGPVMAALRNLPDEILEECRSIFPQFLQKVYREKTGFVKGKYLVLSTEILFRQCGGDIDEFMDTLNQAYALVESRYCSISRLAMEAGFWQVCPELGGFFWRHTDFPTQFPFLQEFLEERFVSLKNFSLSIGPYYLFGGGYFSYFRNCLGKIVVWYVPNFWSEEFVNVYHADLFDAETFWFGWERENRFGYGPEDGPQYGFPYMGLTPMEFARNIREGYCRAAILYHR